MALARLLADLEPVPRDDVEFLFAARFDTKHDEATIAYVQKKFTRTNRHTTRRTGTGWPTGCNDLVADTYQWLIERNRFTSGIATSAVMFMEADCVPTQKDWLNQVLAEWKGCGKMILGAWQSVEVCGIEHINGNCIISMEFWKKHKQFLNPMSGGWDSDFANIMVPEAAASKTIYSDYWYGTERNPFQGCGRFFEDKMYHHSSHPLYNQVFKPCWYHGAKGFVGLDCVRKNLLEPTQ